MQTCAQFLDKILQDTVHIYLLIKFHLIVYLFVCMVHLHLPSRRTPVAPLAFNLVTRPVASFDRESLAGIRRFRRSNETGVGVFPLTQNFEFLQVNSFG